MWFRLGWRGVICVLYRVDEIVDMYIVRVVFIVLINYDYVFLLDKIYKNNEFFVIFEKSLFDERCLLLLNIFYKL